MTKFDKRLETSRSILNSLISLGKITINSTDETIDNYVILSVDISDRLINELTTVNTEDNSKIINDKFDYYELGNNEVDRIMNLPYDNLIDINLKEELLKENLNIVEKFKEDYYSHLNALFLNVILNRLHSYPNHKNAENRAFEARQATADIIYDFRNKLQNK